MIGVFMILLKVFMLVRVKVLFCILLVFSLFVWVWAVNLLICLVSFIRLRWFVFLIMGMIRLLEGSVVVILMLMFFLCMIVLLFIDILIIGKFCIVLVMAFMKIGVKVIFFLCFFWNCFFILLC